MRTLKMSAPLSQNTLGSTPAFAEARWTCHGSAKAVLSLSSSIDLQSVLIRAGQEQCILSFQDLPPLDDVREDHGIQVADMRGSIDIENRRGDVVGFLGSWLCRDIPIAVATRVAWRADPGQASWNSRQSAPEYWSRRSGYAGVHTCVATWPRNVLRESSNSESSGASPYMAQRSSKHANHPRRAPTPPLPPPQTQLKASQDDWTRLCSCRELGALLMSGLVITCRRV
jgi:hypothetical protein